MKRTFFTLATLVFLASCESTPGTANQGAGGAVKDAGQGGGSGGVQGTGGKAGTGGAQGSGGATGTTSTGTATGTGGTSRATGGTVQGGATGSGGVTRDGGAATGGTTAGTGGASGKGGSSGGTTATGGVTATGGTSATSRTTGTGGVTTSGGTTATGGAKATGGASGSGGATAASGPGDQCKPIGWATRTGRTGTAVSVTGGGSASPIVVTNFADLRKYASDGEPRVIHIDGTLGAGWSGQTGDRLEIKSNKTIIGLRPGTQLKAPIHINSASNVIVRNIVIRGPGSNEDQAWDNLNIEGSSKNIWIDHCEFWDGQDGNADIVKGADTVTFTWNIFGYSISGHSHNLSNLIASSDSEPESEGKLDITFMFNWWKAVAQRQPRCRYGQIHVVNNLYTSDSSVGASQLGVTNGFSCNVLTENNHFIGQKEPIDLGKQAGSGSIQEAVGNLFESCSGNQKGSGSAFTPPYEYKSFMMPASEVKALVQKSAGATLASPTSCAQ